MFAAWARARSVTHLAFTPPAPQPDRAGIALVAILRDEARHIGEWARFHHLAGVRHFIIYDNGSRDGTAAALRAALPEGALTLLPWAQKLRDGRRGRELHNQLLAYAHATCNFGGAYRWITYLDADEFLFPQKAATLEEALAPLADCPQISLPWHMFGRAGHEAAPPGGVLENYLWRHPSPLGFGKGLSNFKTIADPCRITALKVHQLWTEGRSDTWNDQGQKASARGRWAPGFYSAAALQLNHYYTRSAAELRAKIARGPNLTTAEDAHLRRVLRKAEAIEEGAVEDRAALEFLARRGLSCPI